MNVFAERNLEALDQGAALLRRLEALDAELYAADVGPHFRHCIDFYDCFLSGFAARRVDYDARERSAIVESSPAEALASLARIRGRLEEVAAKDCELAVRADAVHEWTRSTLDRELLFLLGHTVHHYALIAFMLRQRGIEVPDDFGFAPSTLEHRRLQAECAR